MITGRRSCAKRNQPCPEASEVTITDRRNCRQWNQRRLKESRVMMTGRSISSTLTGTARRRMPAGRDRDLMATKMSRLGMALEKQVLMTTRRRPLWGKMQDNPESSLGRSRLVARRRASRGSTLPNRCTIPGRTGSTVTVEPSRPMITKASSGTTARRETWRRQRRRLPMRLSARPLAGRSAKTSRRLRDQNRKLSRRTQSCRAPARAEAMKQAERSKAPMGLPPSRDERARKPQAGASQRRFRDTNNRTPERPNPAASRGFLKGIRASARSSRRGGDAAELRESRMAPARAPRL
mmetsp:Transcript_4171/g.10051  ORF Transcript_4171/g.10051 Transcript_4171/m.10051 type:complete len:295 (-) Transcript_4171:1343-2227(-)